jgi:hypothetical protein
VANGAALRRGAVREGGASAGGRGILGYRSLHCLDLGGIGKEAVSR